MTTTGRYQGIADGVKVAATSTAERDRRESLGRAVAALGRACAVKAVDCAIVQASYLTKPSLRVAITNPRTGQRITERGDLLEIIDRAADRLNREDWDR